ncbi:hypothetical protein BT63DRAFT_450738 [Microthyrium microscopicum]|uniref:Uncharacterized protein n=1 Tax=Microthyrium microscopicum TaxID=703497 RepID=A0A6A6UKG9_9PEZI|nr:hypothetical protein BT63DRAFT_450738 [Microthyrium microscopicum]
MATHHTHHTDLGFASRIKDGAPVFPRNVGCTLSSLSRCVRYMIYDECDGKSLRHLRNTGKDMRAEINEYCVAYRYFKVTDTTLNVYTGNHMLWSGKTAMTEHILNGPGAHFLEFWSVEKKMNCLKPFDLTFAKDVTKLMVRLQTHEHSYSWPFLQRLFPNLKEAIFWISETRKTCVMSAQSPSVDWYTIRSKSTAEWNGFMACSVSAAVNLPVMGSLLYGIWQFRRLNERLQENKLEWTSWMNALREEISHPTESLFIFDYFGLERLNHNRVKDALLKESQGPMDDATMSILTGYVTGRAQSNLSGLRSDGTRRKVASRLKSIRFSEPFLEGRLQKLVQALQNSLQTDPECVQKLQKQLEDACFLDEHGQPIDNLTHYPAITGFPTAEGLVDMMMKKEVFRDFSASPYTWVESEQRWRLPSNGKDSKSASQEIPRP